MRKFFIIAIFTFISTLCNAQGYYFYISGKVINKESGLPMMGASVFAQNTTLGTSTDAEGRFMLQLPNGGYDLVVTFTGFITESRRINTTDATDKNIVFTMGQKEKEMEAVSLVATTEVKDGLEKYGSFFMDHFIGKTENSVSCKIINPEVLKFYFSKKRNRLKVMAAEPLMIENKALGYNIRYSLDSFTYAYDNDISLYTGYPLYEEMTAADNIQQYKWDQARKKAYKGSILHFMRSIYNKVLAEEGFEIQFLVSFTDKEVVKDTALRLKNIYSALNYNRDDSTGILTIKPNQQKLAVIFSKEKPADAYLLENSSALKDFQFSILNFTQGASIMIEQNGFYFEQNDIAISEYWTWDKAADQLPYNYINYSF